MENHRHKRALTIVSNHQQLHPEVPSFHPRVVQKGRGVDEDKRSDVQNQEIRIGDGRISNSKHGRLGFRDSAQVALNLA